jgi:hypothetical protein
MRLNSKTIKEILNEYSKDFLEQKYWEKGITTRDIAKMIITSQPTVRKLFKQLGIKIKNKYKDYDGPLKGHKFSEEHKQKISKALSGKKGNINPNTGRGLNFRQKLVNCSQCGKEFLLQQCKIKKTKNYFCSKICWRTFRSNLIGEKNPKFSSIKQKCDGPTCDNIIYVKKSRILQSKTNKFFCCTKCNGEWKSLNLFGDKIYNFRGGSWADRYYGPRWGKIKNDVRNRDDNTCQNCGKTTANHEKQLDVHHIIPWRFFERDNIVDYNKANCYKTLNNNLISYCNKCHTTIEAETNQVLDLIGEKYVKSLYC